MPSLPATHQNGSIKRKLYNHKDNLEDNEFNNDIFITNWKLYFSHESAFKRPLESLRISYNYINEIYLSIILQNVIIPYLTYDTINLLAKSDYDYSRWEFLTLITTFVLISFTLRSRKYTFIIFITVLQLSPIIKNLNKTTDFNTIVNISFWLSIVIIFLKSMNQTKFPANSKLSFKNIIVINLQLSNIIIMSSRFSKLLQVAIYLLINIQHQILIPVKYGRSMWFKRVNYVFLVLISSFNFNLRQTQNELEYWNYLNTNLLIYGIIFLLFLNITVLLKHKFTNHIIKNKIDKKNIPFFQAWEIRLPVT
ncbi:hypothetical protein QEN19_001991 [Hanseniaspora menglaensis]